MATNQKNALRSKGGLHTSTTSADYPTPRLKPLSIASWLSLQEIAKFVGKAVYGHRWNDWYIDQPESAVHEVIRHEVSAVLETGRVKIIGDDTIDKFELSHSDFLHDCSSILIHKNGIMPGRCAGLFLFIYINKEDFAREYKKLSASRNSCDANKSREDDACLFLTSSIEEQRFSQRKDFLAEVRLNYALPEAAIKRIWKQATTKTGRSDLVKAGRRKSTN